LQLLLLYYQFETVLTFQGAVVNFLTMSDDWMSKIIISLVLMVKRVRNELWDVIIEF